MGTTGSRRSCWLSPRASPEDTPSECRNVERWLCTAVFAAVPAAGAAAGGPVFPGVLAGPVPGGRAARLAAGLDPGFLAGIGWDPAARVIVPPPGHPRLRDAGSGVPASGGNAGMCAVPQCARQVSAPGRVLCREHRRLQRVTGELPLQRFVALPQTGPLPRTGPCRVTACPRDRSSRTSYCEAHQYQLRIARRAGGDLDEVRWRLTASPIPVGGQVSLRGLPVLVAVEVLYGLQQRTRAGFTTRLHVLRALAEELRRSGAASIQTAGELPGPMARDKQAILNSLARQVRSALGDTSAEVMKDVWDLAAFGSRGQLSFAAISQGWLRQAAKFPEDLARPGCSYRLFHGRLSVSS